ncbi:hypothetical protein D3C87_1595420 [compost metagenome]
MRLVHLENLGGLHAVGIPRDPCFDRGGGALDVTGSKRQMPACLRNLLDIDLEAILFENASLLGKRQWRKAGPAGHAYCNRCFGIGGSR